MALRPLFYTRSGYHLMRNFVDYGATPCRNANGHLYVGYGHTGGVTKKTRFTEGQAEYWLQTDLQQIVDSINKTATFEFEQEEFNDLVESIFAIRHPQ